MKVTHTIKNTGFLFDKEENSFTEEAYGACDKKKKCCKKWKKGGKACKKCPLK